MSGKNKNLNEAIKRLVPKINVPEILNIVSSVECISSKRKTYYSNLLKGRYEQILIPALENALNKERLAKQETKEFSVEDQKDFYKKVIQPIKEAANYKSYDLQYNNVSFKIKKISDNKVLLNDSNDQLLGVLKLGNNRTDICHFISALNNQLEKSFSKQKSFPSSIGDNDFER